MADWPATKLHTVVYVDHVCAGYTESVFTASHTSPAPTRYCDETVAASCRSNDAGQRLHEHRKGHKGKR